MLATYDADKRTKQQAAWTERESLPADAVLVDSYARASEFFTPYEVWASHKDGARSAFYVKHADRSGYGPQPNT